MYFEASLVWDPEQILPEPFLITINFVEFATVVEELEDEEEAILTIDKVLGSSWNDPTFEQAGSKPSFIFDLAYSDFTESERFEEELGSLLYTS